jgi:hypothetical protein
MQTRTSSIASDVVASTVDDTDVTQQLPDCWDDADMDSFTLTLPSPAAGSDAASSCSVMTAAASADKEQWLVSPARVKGTAGSSTGGSCTGGSCRLSRCFLSIVQYGVAQLWWGLGPM